MENIAIESWLVIMGMSGLALGLVVGVGKVLRRLFAPKPKASRSGSPRDRQPQFEDEVQIRVFRQQADRAFQSITAVIDEEYKTLRRMIESGHDPIQAHPSLQHDRQLSAALRPLANRPGPSADQDRPSPYAQVDKYRGQGLGTDEIARILQLPHNEVELAIKLKAARHAALSG